MALEKKIGEVVGSAAREGLERLAKATDDWGWKGAKKGELSGVEIAKALSDDNGRALSRLDMMAPKARNEFVQKVYKQSERFVEKYPNSALAQRMSMRRKYYQDYGSTFPEVMKDLERAGIPRKWTGKVAASVSDYELGNLGLSFDTFAQNLSGLMRYMNNAQRETFLNILPRWTGTLDQAATAAKKLYKRPS